MATRSGKDAADSRPPWPAAMEKLYRKRTLDLLALFDIAKQLNSLDLIRMINFFLVTVCGHFGVTKAAILLLEEGSVQMSRCRGCSDEMAPPGTPIPQAVSRFLVEAAAPVSGSEAARSGLAALWANEADPAPEVVAPIVRERGLTGIILTGPKATGERFSGDDMEFLASLASLAGVAIDNARYVESLKAKDEELMRAYKELKTLDRQKDDFIKIASHELNTPLTVVRLTGSLLLDPTTGPLTEFQKKLVHQIDQSSERLQEINEDLIHLARSHYDRIQLHRESGSLKKILHGVETRVRPLLERRPDLTLVIDLQPRLPEVFVDTKKYVKVFEYLIQNAIKYTPEEVQGTIHLSIKLDETRSAIVCTVRDEGIGIDSKDQDRVFEPFVELGEVDKRSTDKTRFQGAGLGLGLAIVKDIIETDRGTIRIESDGTDCGTAVIFTILTKSRFLKTVDLPIDPAGSRSRG